MDKYFLDCGAWNGYSVRVFRQLYDIDSEYVIHSFEVDPRHLEIFPSYENNILHNKAVWVEDCFIDFYLDYSKKKASGTLIKEKTTGKLDKKNPYKADAIDFDRWIKAELKKDDYIVLKLDIEGAEYEVLPHMIRNGSMEYINKLFIEWHWNKIGLSYEVHKSIVRQINIPIIERWKLGYKK